jgi:hypothetical protein
MIKQTWLNTPWYAVYLTHGRALAIVLALILFLTGVFVIGFGLGRKYR